MILPNLYKDDLEAWAAYPDHRWVYDRLAVSTGSPCDILPTAFPVIVKPVINLSGMGLGATVVYNLQEYSELGAMAGFMWSPLYSGRHVSTDCVVAAGELSWSAQALGICDGPRRFAAWFLGEVYPDEMDIVARFVAEKLPRYAGALNIETVGGNIIEVHLRLTQDWISAGSYDAYPAPLSSVGIPVFRPIERHECPASGIYIPDDGSPRFAMIVVPSGAPKPPAKPREDQ
jgi:hypothetical protein